MNASLQLQMGNNATPPWRALGLALMLCALLVLWSCAPRIELPRSGELPRPAVATWGITEWLALVAGFAAIVVAVVFAFLREYAAGLTASLGCLGLCAAFLVLPTVVTAFKWAFIVCLVLAVAGVGYLAVTRIRHPDAPLSKLFGKLKAKS